MAYVIIGLFSGFKFKILPLRLRRVVNETEQERKYREACEALHQWSSRFWAHHNSLFEKKKAEFIEQVCSKCCSLTYGMFRQSRQRAPFARRSTYAGHHPFHECK